MRAAASKEQADDVPPVLRGDCHDPCPLRPPCPARRTGPARAVRRWMCRYHAADRRRESDACRAGGGQRYRPDGIARHHPQRTGTAAPAAARTGADHDVVSVPRERPLRAAPAAPPDDRPRPLHADQAEPVPARRRGTRLHILARRRHRLLCVRACVFEPRHAAAARRSADRGAGELFPL